MTNQRLEYTSAIPAVFPFDYEQIVAVERAPRDEDEPALPESGSVVLTLGDVLVVAEDFDIVHAHLLDLDAPADPVETGKGAAPSVDKAEKTPSKAAKAPSVPEPTAVENARGGVQEPQKDAESGETTPETPEPANSGELGNVLDGIATQHIPSGMTDAFREAGIIPDTTGKA